MFYYTPNSILMSRFLSQNEMLHLVGFQEKYLHIRDNLGKNNPVKRMLKFITFFFIYFF